MSNRLALRSGLAALVILTSAATLWLSVVEPRVVVLGVPVLALGGFIALDDPPGSRVRHAGGRVLMAMALGAVLPAGVAWAWPAPVEPRDVLMFAAGMSGGFASGLAAVIWYAVRLTRPIQTRRVPMGLPAWLEPFEPPDLPDQGLPLERW